LKTLAHVGGVDEFHQGLAVGAERSGRVADDGFGGSSGAMHDEGFLAFEINWIKPMRFELFVMPVPADVAGDVFFAGLIEEVVAALVILKGACGPGWAVLAETGPGFTVIKKEDEPVPVL